MVVVAALVVTSAACGKKNNNDKEASSAATVSTVGQGTSPGESQGTTEAETIKPTETEEASNPGNEAADKPQLLQSASVDLDSDGVNEEVEALVIEHAGDSGNETGTLEGVLKITDGSEVKNITFIKKPAGLTSVMMGIEFPDLDGDGSKDIFLIIPESGASFSLNYFYAYSYKKDQSYAYTTDSNLSDLAAGFVFKYQKEGRLEVTNSLYGIKAVMDISDSSGFESDDDNNYSYENSWVEPIPVEISESSRISLVKEQNGNVSIKVPLPVFGRGTVDMIGEVDLYYKVDKNFKPELKSFEILDFSKDGPISKGKWNKD